MQRVPRTSSSPAAQPWRASSSPDCSTRSASSSCRGARPRRLFDGVRSDIRLSPSCATTSALVTHVTYEVSAQRLGRADEPAQASPVSRSTFGRRMDSGSAAALEHRPCSADRDDQPIEVLSRQQRVVPPEALAPVLTDFIAIN